MRNLFIGFLILAVVLIGGGIVASVAYQAGVSTAVTTVAASAPDGAVVTPVAPYPYPYGYGWGWGQGGFPFLGILAGLFFLFLLFALIRAATWRGPGWRGGGWGDHDHRSRFHDTFDEWHRKAHEGGSPPTS